MLRSLLNHGLKGEENPDLHLICSQIPSIQKEHLLRLDLNKELEFEEQSMIIRILNQIIDEGDWRYSPLWQDKALNQEARTYLNAKKQKIPFQKQRLGRLLLEHSFNGSLYISTSSLHTQVGIPGFKNLFIPMGIFYIILVVLIVVSGSNAVNLTDGLDGLAIGSSIISIVAYAGIAYIVSRSDWSRYLFLTYVPEASELFVFGSALLVQDWVSSGIMAILQKCLWAIQVHCH